jgi:hypothetical protein
MCLFVGNLRSTKDMAAIDGVGQTCLIHIVLRTDVACRVGTDYEHD